MNRLDFLNRTWKPAHSVRAGIVGAVIMAIMGGGGCGDDGPDGNDPTPDAGMVDATPEPGPFVLQLLHAADMEAGADALDDAPRFSAVLDALRQQMPEQTLVLSSGDNYIPGPFFGASEDDSLIELLGDQGPGLADIAILNAMGFQASAVGNHEFDSGPDTVRNLITRREIDEDDDGTPDRVYPGASFPYLTSNLDFSAEDALADLVEDGDVKQASEIPGRIARSTVITVDGEQIGIVGATTPALPSLSSIGDIAVSPENPEDIAALAAIIQEAVDELTSSPAYEIDKVILLAHMQQLAIEKQLAGLLRDVDIIVAGGSNTLLADDTDRLRAGDTAVDSYPLLLSSAADEPVAVVNTDGNYRYVGRLVVEFDDAGLIVPDSVDAAVSGIYATDEQGVAALENATPLAMVEAVTTALRNVIITLDGNIFGKATVFLNGERTSVRTEETNLGNLSSDAMLAAARKFEIGVDLAIRNGGGIRSSIGVITYPPGSTDPDDLQRLPTQPNEAAGKEEGDVSQFDVQNALRFDNQLTVLTVTAAQLEEIVEHAVAAVAPGATPGQFPQIAGFRFSFDPSAEPGNRVQSMALYDGADNHQQTIMLDGNLIGDPTRTFRVVTLAFLADGGDGYPFPTGGAVNRVDLTPDQVPQGTVTFAPAGGEQHALATYLLESYPDAADSFDVEDVPAAQDERIQNLSVREDTVVPLL